MPIGYPSETRSEQSMKEYTYLARCRMCGAERNAHVSPEEIHACAAEGEYGVMDLIGVRPRIKEKVEGADPSTGVEHG